MDKNGTLQRLARDLYTNKQIFRTTCAAIQTFEETRAPKMAGLVSAIETMLQGVDDVLEVLQGQDDGP